MCFGGRKLKEEHIYQVQASDRKEAPVMEWADRCGIL